MADLAIHGGTPVRTTPFPSSFLGASVLGDEELKEISEVIETKSPFRFYGVGNPDKVARFEEKVCEHFGVKYALAVSSGTSALVCAIAALGVGPGDEVIIPSFAWHSDYCALIPFGVLPVFADVGEDLNLDPADFEKKITDKTKAVIIVHYQGCPAKMEELVSIARAHNLLIIEDIAQAFGGSYKDTLLGTMGDIATVSFQTHKMITAGEGGMIFTNNEDFYIRAIRYHDLGNVRPFFIDKIEHKEKADRQYAFSGMQLRMSELQGACLLAQMGKVEFILETCRRHHARLRAHMESYPQIQVRYREGDMGYAFIMLAESPEQAEAITKALCAEGIPCGPTSNCRNLLGDVPIKNRGMVHPDLPPFGPGCAGEDVYYDAAKDCLNTDKIWNRVVAIGIGPTFTDQEIDDIITALDKVLPELL